ncbi:beta-glucosidase BglX [Melittangium boletus]|uniref:beta-glucosidase BglX n=1 Tax=Melittangium boletus TaxID=83453 RepID=UPI003DA266EA
MTAHPLLGAGLAALALAAPIQARPADAPPRRATAKQVDAAAWTRADTAEMDRFIALLMAKMTLEEKIGQMTLFTSDWDTTGPTLRASYRDDIRAGRVGAVFNAYTARYTRDLQRIAVEESRLKLPLLFGYDVIHGHRTIFPIPLGEAASWDLEAVERSARVSAEEATAEGLHWTFAPMVDIARDARWGRVSEGAGEAVYLARRIAEARVRGYQGEDPRALNTLLATVKHYAAYGAAQAGRDYHTVDISERTLRDIYLPPFKAAIDAGAASLMTAFNEYDGVPATGSTFLLTDVLRAQWGFQGFVVTDYTSINEMVPHGYARDLAQAGEQAVNAGVDMDMQGAVYMNHLARLVEEGRVPMARVDAAVKAILRMKYRLGLFDDPYRYSDEQREQATVYRREFLDAAREVARKSMVLLKNENGTLPLAASVKRIAVIGPLGHSKEDMLGSWSAAGDRKERPVTLLEGLRARGKGVTVTHARGASYTLGDTDTSGFAEALAVARDADVIVAAMGEKWDMTGEAASRADLGLPGTQEALLEALKTLGKPIVLVVLSGRPNTLGWAQAHVDAILHAWYPGTMGGHAIADVLHGDYNPSGKLPVTFPRTVGQVPLHHDMKNTGRPISPDTPAQKYLSRYLDVPNTPLYAFGHGLSYTTFGYSPITLDKRSIRPGEALTATVTVTNTGKRAGEEVVQLYVRDLVGSVTRPVLELKGWEKVKLAPGERRRVRFTLTDADLAFTRKDMSWGAEPGDFSLFIGTASDKLQEARFTLTP